MTTNSSAIDARRHAAAEWCMAHVDGEMEGETLARFEAWLAVPENEATFRESVEIWRALEEAADSAELIRMRTAALTSFSEANSERWMGRVSRQWRGRYAIAACMLAIIAGTFTILHSDRPTPPASVVAIAPTAESYQTGIGERRLAVLTDGSKLSLDAGTRVLVSMRGNLRQLTLLSGRARFDVAKDASRPFIVYAADRAILALGTSFSVELVDHKVRVVLVEGRVSVVDKVSVGSSPDDVDRIASLVRASRIVAPGEELVTSASGAAIAERVAAVDVARSLSWESGQVLFDDTDLVTAAARVNRYSKTQVLLGDFAATHGKVSGVFTQGDAESFAEAAAVLNDLTIVRSSDNLRLVSRTKLEN